MGNWSITSMAKIIPPNIPAPHHYREKWVTLSNDNLSLMNLLDVDVEMLSDNKKRKTTDFLIGNIYSLGSESVEGVEFKKLYFVICGVIGDYKGHPINSLIVREVSIDENGKVTDNANSSGRRKFSIPPSMCKLFGIKYSPGYEIWPMNSGFEHVDLSNIGKQNKEINYGDMSTYPVSRIDGTIRKIILELHGFSSFNTSHIITPTGAMIPTNDFTSSLTIFARQNISTDNGCAGFKIGESFPFRIVVRPNNESGICDENHNIYIEVNLTRKSLNKNTEDGLIGVSHTSLDGKDIDDIISVKWDESTDENNINHQPKHDGDIIGIDVSNEINKVFESLNKHFARNGFYQIWE